MRKFLIPITALTLSAPFAVPSYAAIVSVSWTLRVPTVDQNDGGVPPNYYINDYFVTTDADILRIGDVNVVARLYNDPLGSDTAPPNPTFVTLFPELGADSFITTPGETAVAGNSEQPFDTNSSFFDSSNDGPVTDFNFARLTSPDLSIFEFVVSVAGTTGPEVFQFRLPVNIPEPTAMILLLTAGLSAGGCRSYTRCSA